MVYMDWLRKVIKEYEQIPNPIGPDGHIPRRQTLKMIIVGDSGVGKTTLMLQWIEHKPYPPLINIGYEFMTKEVRLSETEVYNVCVFFFSLELYILLIMPLYSRFKLGILPVKRASDLLPVVSTGTHNLPIKSIVTQLVIL